MTNIEFLRSEVNGTEFFTLIATGESAVSERGLAKMSGVPRKTIARWFADLGHQGVPEWLKPLQGIPLDLGHEIKKRGKEIKAIPADTAAKFISLVARNLKTDSAFDSLEAFLQIGLTSYIQGVTGWLPQEFQSSPVARQTVDRILDKPSPWVKLYDKDFCRQVYAWFGPSFYWQFCYFYLTPVERCKVEMVNPIVNGTRKYRIHQHLDADTRSRIEPYIWQLIPIVDLADGDKDKFMENYRRYFGHVEQLSFLDQLQ